MYGLFTTESAPVAIGPQRYLLGARMECFTRIAGSMLRDIETVDCTLKHALLGIVSVRTMIGITNLLLDNSKSPAAYLMLAILDENDEKSATLVQPDEHEALIAKIRVPTRTEFSISHLLIKI